MIRLFNRDCASPCDWNAGYDPVPEADLDDNRLRIEEVLKRIFDSGVYDSTKAKLFQNFDT